MAGVAIDIHDAAATDKILSVKQRVCAANRNLYVRRQRLVYTAGPFGIDPLLDDETLGGAGVAVDGSAKLDVLLADFSAAEAADLGARLIGATVFGRADEILHILAEGADINFEAPTGIRGRTALFISASHGHVGALKVFIDGGADKEARSENGRTALLISAYFGRLECLRLLLECGADKEVRDSDGETALMVASRNGYNACVVLLFEAGANKEAMNKSRRDGGNAD